MGNSIIRWILSSLLPWNSWTTRPALLSLTMDTPLKPGQVSSGNIKAVSITRHRGLPPGSRLRVKWVGMEVAIGL